MPNGNVYATGKYVVLFIAMAKLFDMATSINEEIIAYSEYYHYALSVMLLLVGLTVLTNLWLIPIYGIVGSAMATAITIFLYNVAKFFIIYAKFKIQPFSVATLKVILVSILVFLANQCLPSLQNLFSDLIIRSVLVSILYIGMIYVVKASEDINTLIHQIVKSVLKR